MSSVVGDFVFGVLAYYPMITFALAFPYLAWKYMDVRWFDTRWAPAWMRGVRWVVVGVIFLFGITAPYFVASYFGIGPEVPDSSPNFVGHRRGVPLELLPFAAGMFVVAVIPQLLSVYLKTLDAVVSKINATKGDDDKSGPGPRRFLTDFERAIDDLLGQARYIHSDAIHITDAPEFYKATENSRRKAFKKFSKARFLIVLRRKLDPGQAPKINALYTPPGNKRFVIVAEDEWNLGGMFHRMPYATITGGELMKLLNDKHTIVFNQRGLTLHADLKTLRALEGPSSRLIHQGAE